MNLDRKIEALLIPEDSGEEALPAIPGLANLLAIDETWLCYECDQDIARCLCKRPT